MTLADLIVDKLSKRTNNREETNLLDKAKEAKKATKAKKVVRSNSKDIRVISSLFRDWYDGKEDLSSALHLADVMFSYNKVTDYYSKSNRRDSTYFLLLDDLRHTIIKKLSCLPGIEAFLIATSKVEGKEMPFYGKVDINLINKVVYAFKPKKDDTSS